MKQIVFTVFSFCCFPLLVYSQTTTLSGLVRNKQGKPLIVSVTVQAKGSTTISGFATSDVEGRYSVEYKGDADSLTLVVSGIMVGKHYRSVPNKTATVDFTVEENTLELKDVVVTAMPIRRTGDTLNYLVSSYTNQSDRTIEDALKKMPGILVDESSAISYNGKKINKFYIENMDLLGGRYGIATQNIPAKDVASVQVFENHQPIKALKDRAFSEQAALNLKLKDKAKGKLTLSAQAGAGYEPVLWNAELVGMYFSGKKQNITTYKGNNSGNNVAIEQQEHYDYDMASADNSSILSVGEPSTPPVAKKRYLFNTSNCISSNQLFKIKDKELTANINFYNDRVEKEGYSFSEQFLPGDTSLRIEEQVRSLSKVNNLNLLFRMNHNTEGYYLNNKLTLSGAWNNDRASGITRSNAGDMDETISQFLDKPTFAISESLNLIKNIGDKSYKFFFSAAYSQKPHSLSVTPADYFGDNRMASLEQNALSEDFISTLRGSYGLRLGNFNLDYTPWISVNLRNLDTKLNGVDILGILIPAADSLRNNLRYNTYRVGIDQNYTYKSENGKFKASLLLPVSNYTLTTDDHVPDRFNSYNRWIINPTFTTSYDLTNELTALAGANYQKSYGNMNDAYTGYIMHSYRSLLRNTIDELFETQSTGSNARLSYRNAMQAFFINAGIDYGKSKKNLLYGYNYQGIMSVKTTINQPTESENYGLNLHGSKGIQFWRTTFNAYAGYGESRGDQLIQNEVLNYRTESYQVGGSIGTAPASFMDLNYRFSWLQSQSFAEELPNRFPSIRSQMHVANAWFFPTRSLSINLSGDYQYNSAVSNHNTTFADAKIRYKYKQTVWELECNNLLNAKQYVSASYTDISSYYYSYDLRPRSFLLKVKFNLK